MLLLAPAADGLRCSVLVLVHADGALAALAGAAKGRSPGTEGTAEKGKLRFPSAELCTPDSTAHGRSAFLAQGVVNRSLLLPAVTRCPTCKLPADVSASLKQPPVAMSPSGSQFSLIVTEGQSFALIHAAARAAAGATDRQQIDASAQKTCQVADVCAAAGAAAAGGGPAEEKPKRGREASTEAAVPGERAARSGRTGWRGGWRKPRQAAAKAAADQEPHEVPAPQHWMGDWPTSICSPLK